MGDTQADKIAGKRALAITFLVLGLSLCVTFGLTLGPAFIGIGLPFAVLGFIFLPKADEGQKSGGDR
ncbi:hypothetical protein [Erythrobacter longus]|nr:hypothetical protein [Erythrobacter longus]